jgi:hypothetical protein
LKRTNGTITAFERGDVVWGVDPFKTDTEANNPGDGLAGGDVDPEHIARIIERYPVPCAVLYGSQIRGTATADSDVDIAVAFEEGLSPTERLERRIDLIRKSISISRPNSSGSLHTCAKSKTVSKKQTRVEPRTGNSRLCVDRTLRSFLDERAGPTSNSSVARSTSNPID